MRERSRLISGHWSDCGLIWDWPCDCGVAEERRKAKEALLEPFEKIAEWLRRRLA